MRLSLRFIIPLMLALAAIAYSVVPLVDQLTLRWFVRDLDIRTKLITAAVQEPLAQAMTADLSDRVRQQRILFERFSFLLEVFSESSEEVARHPS